MALAAKHCPKVLSGTWFSTSLHTLRTLTAEQQLGTCILCRSRHLSIRLVPAYEEPLPCQLKQHSCKAPLICRGNLVLEQANNGKGLPLTPVPSASFLCSVFFSASQGLSKLTKGMGGTLCPTTALSFTNPFHSFNTYEEKGHSHRVDTFLFKNNQKE